MQRTMVAQVYEIGFIWENRDNSPFKINLSHPGQDISEATGSEVSVSSRPHMQIDSTLRLAIEIMHFTLGDQKDPSFEGCPVIIQVRTGISQSGDDPVHGMQVPGMRQHDIQVNRLFERFPAIYHSCQLRSFDTYITNPGFIQPFSNSGKLMQLDERPLCILPATVPDVFQLLF